MIGKTYGLNWIEVIRRILAIALFWGLAAFFIWVMITNEMTLKLETVFGAVFSVLCLGVGVWLLQNVIGALLQNPRVTLHERGVTLKTNRDEMEWDWDEFTHWSGKMMFQKLYGIITMHISGACTFYSADKPPLSINGLFKDAPLVAGRIILQTIKLQTPKQIAAFQRGETLNFDPITLNKEGLREGSTFIPFDDITGASINEYYLWVFRKSQPKPTRFTAGDNLRAPDLLLAVINNLAQPPTN
jgi:hypothetical protein